MADTRLNAARRLMADFAARTGLTGGDASRRYLWTDAFAVFALAGLATRTHDSTYLDQIRRLVDLVHHSLARHRPDDARSGWISGFADVDAQRHPTARGLRIGKPLPERTPDQPQDDRLEWDRDGQYFHYLTRWMQALDLASTATGDPGYREWAVELAVPAHGAFVYHQGGQPRMYWKVSIDLSRPLVLSMGQHDPLDGYVSLVSLDAHRAPSPPRLDAQIIDLRRICEGVPTWATTDALGIGGLLADAGRLTRLIATDTVVNDPLLERLLADARRSLRAYAARRDLAGPPSSRLPFRELGLSIGLRSLVPTQALIAAHVDRFASEQAAGVLRTHLGALVPLAPLGASIADFWLTPDAQASPTWDAHLDINAVMLATALVPDALVPLEVANPVATTVHASP
jgi:hypothetical protein